MATVYSQYGANLVHPNYLWNTGSTWQSGLVPTSADTVYIQGYRTTVNQTSISPWTGVLSTITVASTANFPSTGSCYTYTTLSNKIKIDYSGKTATQFQNCTIDQSYQKFSSTDYYKYGGTISNGSYVYSPAPIIIVDSGTTATYTLCIILYNGQLQVENGGIIEQKGSYMDVQDGTFYMKNGSTFKYMVHNALCRIIGNQSYISRIIIEGDEVRSNSILTSDLNTGSTYLTCSDASGFAIGDKISVYQQGDFAPGIVDFQSNYSSMRLGTSGSTYDEGFDVCGVNGNDIYLKLRNGIEAPILSATTTSGVATIYVDEQRFNNGEKIVINNSEYTITSVEDADFLLRDYNFTAGATLDDWTTDTGFTTYYSNFSLGGSSLKHSTTTANNILVKNLWIKNVKVEAWISPLDQITGGTRGTGYYAVLISNDPVMDKNSIASIYKSCQLIVDDSANYTYMANRNYTTVSTTHTLSNMPSTTGLTSLREDCRIMAKYTLENRKGFLRGYINDVLSFENINKTDSMYGTVGILTNNQYMNCTRFKIYSTCQKITVNTNDTFLSGQTIYESGSEYYHPSGSTVVKLSSIISDCAGHTDLAFGYQGKTNGYYPTVRGINSNLNMATTYASPWSLNHDLRTSSYYQDITAGADKYIVYDLMREVIFTHVAYVDYYDCGYNNTTITGVQIWGSNDATSWTEIYAKTADARLSSYAARLRYYSVGTRSYRYVKFGLSGNLQTTANLIINFGVFDFTSGYTITLNNSSDINVGDRVMIGCKSNYHYQEYAETHFYANIVTNKTKNPSDYLSGLMNYYTVIGKTGNTIAFERPYVHGFIDGSENLIKVSRNTTLVGKIAQNEYYKGTIQIMYSFYNGRKYIFRNCEFIHHGTAQWNAGTDYSGFSAQNTDVFNPTLLEGVSYHSGYNGYTYSFHGYYGYNVIRNSYIANMNQIRSAQYSYNIYSLLTNNFFYDINVNNYIYTIKSHQTNYNFSFGGYYSYIEYTNALTYMTGLELMEFKRNYNITFYLNSQEYYPLQMKKFIISDNFYANTYGITLNAHQNFVNSNSLMNNEHTGIKVTGAFDANSVFPSKTVQANPLGKLFYLKNYNKWDYDLTTYYSGLIVKFNNENYARFYHYDGTLNYALFGMDFYLIEDSDLDISLSFDYRHSYDQFYLYQYTNNGGLIMNFLSNSVMLYTQNLTKSITWKNFTYTTKLTNAKAGRYSIVFNQYIWDGYVDIRNPKGDVYSSKGKDNISMYTNNMINLDTLYNPVKYTKSEVTMSSDTNNKIILAGKSVM